MGNDAKIGIPDNLLPTTTAEGGGYSVSQKQLIVSLASGILLTSLFSGGHGDGFDR
jgi:hypothetical protein